MNIISVLSAPIMILNFLGVLVALIWLVFLGEWGLIGKGILNMIVAPWGLSIALLPGMIFAGPVFHFSQKKSNLGLVFFAGLGSLYTILIITVWCLGVLYFYMRGAISENFIPTLIWSYLIATGPWAYMASKDQGAGTQGLYSGITTFFAQLAYLVVMILILFSPQRFVVLASVFLGIMLFGMISQLMLAVNIDKERKIEEPKIGDYSALDQLED